MKSLYRKIANVMKEIRTVKKNGRNEFNKYNYATESDLLEEVKPLLLKHGLIVLPNVVEQRRDSDIATVKVEFALVDVETGEELKTTFFGEGQDKGDKATYKAYTGATKYYLMKTFMIPTGDDPEANDDPESNIKPQKQKTYKAETARNRRQSSTFLATEACIQELIQKWSIISTSDELQKRVGKPLNQLSQAEAEGRIDQLDEHLSSIPMTTRQRKRIFAIGKERGLTSNQVKRVGYNYLSVDSMKKISALHAWLLERFIEDSTDEKLKDYAKSKEDMIRGFVEATNHAFLGGSI